MSKDSLLVVENLKVSFANHLALKGLSLEVNKGEIICLLGANGAGKTTTLMSICQTLPYEGDIAFNQQRLRGVSVNHLTRLGIAIAPEGRRVFQKMSVLDNLYLGAYHLASPSKSTLDYIFELFPVLKERMNQKAGGLSGGEQQMLAIGRALMSEPKLLLLDEPSLGLAPIVIDKIFKALAALNKQTGLSLLIVEQNVKKALAIANRGYVLNNGELAIKGSSATILSKLNVQTMYFA